MKILDINSRTKGMAGELSNLRNYPFIMGGIYYGSIEGFLQSLRVKDVEGQKEVAAMHGIQAKLTAKKNPIKGDTLYYKGEPMSRFSVKYTKLIAEAYDTCFAQNEGFQMAIYASREFELTHSIGKHDPTQTILTINEFIGNLLGLRYRYAEFLKTSFSHMVD